MSSSSSRLNLRQLSCWLQVILLAWGMGSMVQPVSASQVLPRLETETVTDPEQGTTVTAYAYDAANNRASKTVQGGSEPGFWQYDYNVANQLVSWRKLAGPWGTLLKEATLGYDANGNRSEQRVADVATLTAAVTQYSWDAQDRLSAVEMPDGQVHGYEYDYRTRRMGISRAGGQQGGVGTVTAVVFSGGLSLAEWESTGNSEPGTENPPSVHYTRGPDMGGGVGGLLYSRRGETLKYNLSNGRGDIVAQGNAAGALTWTASYEAYGKRTKETGENADKQRANTKDEDPTGLLNEGFRYRDLETGVWLSRDPAGFVDGPNLYAYVKQNPWSKFDADGLWAEDLALGIPSLGVGIASLASNIKKGHVGAAIWDGVGIVADAAAVLLPGVPGGVGLGTKAARLAAAQNKVENAIDTAETVVETGAAVATGDATALVDVAIDKAMDRAMGGGRKARGGIEKSAKEVVEKASTSTMTKKEIENARRRGIDRARREERSLVESGHPGTADGDGWSLPERKLISETGQFPKDTRWHHINDVKRSPEMADNADNVLPSRGGTSGHVEKYHPNGTQNGSSGPMLNRKATEAAQREVQE